jgi:hypothetical protein
MSPFLRNIGIAMICAGIGFGQTLTTPQFNFFNRLFMIIADPSLDPSNGKDPSVQEGREQTVVDQFGLNELEAKSLHAAAESYRGMAVQFQLQVAAIADGKTELSESDRASLASLETRRRNGISQLAVALLQIATPQTKARFSHIMSMDVQQ